MSERDELDLLAAEYALGSLPAAERQAVEARRRADTALDRAIAAWEARLAPLAELVEAVEPPAGLFDKVERSLPGDPGERRPAGDGATVILLRRRVQRWQQVAAGAMGLAAALVLVFALRETGVLPARKSDAPTNFVAMLQKDATSPAFVVSVNIETRELTIRPVAAERADGKSYELWLVNKALPAPRSLGVVDDRPLEASLKAYPPDLVRDSLLAVTLEPKGGSPTGQATGPILFTGKLVQLSP